MKNIIKASAFLVILLFGQYGAHAFFPASPCLSGKQCWFCDGGNGVKNTYCFSGNPMYGNCALGAYPGTSATPAPTPKQATPTPTPTPKPTPTPTPPSTDNYQPGQCGTVQYGAQKSCPSGQRCMIVQSNIMFCQDDPCLTVCGSRGGTLQGGGCRCN